MSPLRRVCEWCRLGALRPQQTSWATHRYVCTLDGDSTLNASTCNAWQPGTIDHTGKWQTPDCSAHEKAELLIVKEASYQLYPLET